MTFFPEIDVEKTKANAKRKLEEYRCWREVANDEHEQRITQVLSFMPRTTGSRPNQVVETLVVNKVSAEQEIEAIERGFNKILSERHRYILLHKHLLNEVEYDYVIYGDLGYESARYYELLEEAYLSFANTYRSGILLVYKS
ncbi:ArpU family phage packaging/lysis transcriptional regulator [Streptococcus cuniculipharyngis]|uniref:ArpU family transcriptional regulator n=1 Tax=Streptococcus cuniculipharyngis TaxID=1562651 RepID=A0A5C5SGT5_9STRE|nr:ArpU family phage packaging/lysis transcriptional regulator [Streptococcus cuniculipharyngis]TWS99155.1 ArpU family transcriptional regulator [Streptococcus cuniculipharyngis]